MFNFMSLAEIFIGGYLIFLAIRGRHKIFTSPFLKNGMEKKYRKTGRIGYVVIGGFTLILGLLNAYASIAYLSKWISYEQYDLLGNIGLVFMVLALTSLVVVFFLFRGMTDKSRKKAGRTTAPRAAFYFDSDEEEKGIKQPQGKKKK